MSSEPSGLFRLTKEHIQQACSTLGRAFHNDPATVTFFPDTEKRARQLQYAFKTPVAYGISHGEVYATSPGFEGVAVWMPSNMVDMPFWEMVTAGGLASIFKVDIRSLWRLMQSDNYLLAAHHRLAPFPHMYLCLLGVDPRYQGQRYATGLLAPMLARLDKEGLPCYLETQTEKNVPMYQHFSFKVIEETTVPKENIRTWIMLREPGK